MTRTISSNTLAALDAAWSAVSESRPCPVCGASASCGTHLDEDFVCCMNEPSEWPLTNGAWLHRSAAVEQSAS
jgi:hypothetical protein